MGDPRKQRRKYERPPHLWKRERILEENEIEKKYGLKNKKEIWKAKSKIRMFRKQAKKLLGMTGEKADREAQELMNKLRRWGIEAHSIEDILGLKIENLLDRRLQTLVYKKNLVATIKQARQLVVHKHVMIGNRIVSAPGYIVPKHEEDLIRLDERIKVSNVGERKGEKATAPEEGKIEE